MKKELKNYVKTLLVLIPPWIPNGNCGVLELEIYGIIGLKLKY